jgi:hypothetical protein
MAAVVALFGVAVLPRSEARSLHRGPEAN